MRALSAALCAAAASAVPADAGCAPDLAEILWPGGSARFAVEIADDSAERAQGLMFRETMSAGAGMLFVYDRPQKVAFWMKNTLIPLDMLFIDGQGIVRRIREMAAPQDETQIPGGDGIRFVLEINGGLARRLGIAEGAALRHPAVPQDMAAAPCD